jgi:hypothetical protein
VQARKFENIDADTPGYGDWTPWRIEVDTFEVPPKPGSRTRRLHGTVAMDGDGTHWTFKVGGTLDCDPPRIELIFDTHEPMSLRLDLSARTGDIHSIDEIWQLGPPFPKRPP